MPRDVPMQPAPWRARLALAFERRGDRTVLASRTHEGPLVVQKPLYADGDPACHVIVVHPPGGIAGGDELTVEVKAREESHALLTTPGAAKWYRSAGPSARQQVHIDLATGATVEWLPQESIVFDGARADVRWRADLAPGARLLAWEVLCLGRTGSGECFAHGAVALEMRIARSGRSLWMERGVLEPGSRALESPAGLGSHSVTGTFVAAGCAIDDETLAACRAVSPAEGEAAVTRMPQLLVARFRGDSSEAARAHFTRLWSLLRPSALGMPAVAPRIWAT
jgi:urease accessory protein